MADPEETQMDIRIVADRPVNITISCNQLVTIEVLHDDDGDETEGEE